MPLKWMKNAYLCWVKHHFYGEEDNSNNWGPETFSMSNHPLAIMVRESIALNERLPL